MELPSSPSCGAAQSTPWFGPCNTQQVLHIIVEASQELQEHCPLCFHEQCSSQREQSNSED